MSLANHPRVWQKVADPQGLAACVAKQPGDDRARVDELFLATVSRLPTEEQRQSCLKYLQATETPEKGLQGVLWSLINTREFLLQH